MNFRRLSLSDLKEPEGDAAKVLSALNDFVDGIEKVQTVTARNVVEVVVSSALVPVKVASPVPNAVGVSIVKASMPDGSPAGTGFTIDWRLQDGQIVILNVYTMAAGTTYKLSLLVV
jgi:hypothetical protein